MKSIICMLALLATILSPRFGPAADAKKTLWSGVIHLGDSADSFPKITSAGMAFQTAFAAETGKASTLTVTVADVQTQAGDGHYVEVIAHFEKQPRKASAKEIVVGTFRIKDKSGDEKAYTFNFNSGKNLEDKKPDYYSVRIKIDTHVGFTFWDDFLLKKIELEQ